MPIDVSKSLSFRSDKPCGNFNSYGCDCGWCHDCGWEKLAHADRTEPTRTEDLERKLTEAEHAIDANRPAQAPAKEVTYCPHGVQMSGTCIQCFPSAQAPGCKNPTAPCECFTKSPAQCPCKCEFCAGRREERVEAAGPSMLIVACPDCGAISDRVRLLRKDGKRSVWCVDCRKYFLATFPEDHKEAAGDGFSYEFEYKLATAEGAAIMAAPVMSDEKQAGFCEGFRAAWTACAERKL